MTIHEKLKELYNDTKVNLTGGEAGEDSGWVDDNEDIGDEDETFGDDGDTDGGWGDDSEGDTDFNDDGGDDFDFDNPFDDDEDDEDSKDSGTGKKKDDPNKSIVDSKLADILRVNIADAYKGLIGVSKANLEKMSDNFRNDDIDFIISNYEKTFNELNHYILQLNNDTDDYSRLETFLMFRGQFRSLVEEYLKIVDSIESMDLVAY